MPPLTGGRKPHYSSVREEDHKGGTSIQRTTMGSGCVQRVWRAAGGRLPVESSDESTWEGVGETTPVDHPGRGKGLPGIPDVLSGKGGTADMPCGGVPGESGDEDANTGALCAPACPRHRGDAGGRKLPPPPVRQALHGGPPEGADWAAPGDRAVSQESREEETAAGRGRDEGELGAGV